MPAAWPVVRIKSHGLINTTWTCEAYAWMPTLSNAVAIAVNVAAR